MNFDVGRKGLVPRRMNSSRSKQKQYDSDESEPREESNDSDDVDESDKNNEAVQLSDNDQLHGSHSLMCTNSDEGYTSCSNTFFRRSTELKDGQYKKQADGSVTHNLFRRIVNRYCSIGSRNQCPATRDDSDYEDLELTPRTVNHEVRMLGDHATTPTLPVSVLFGLQKKDIHVSLNPDATQKLIHSISEDDGQPDEDEGKYVSVEANRETWNRDIDFLLSIIGFAVDLANVWRFPYLCYRNGGGAFLIPYALMLIFGAVPLFYMELILGQYNRQGPISVWRICPIFKGIGFCAVLVAFYVSFYYNVIIGWSLYFLVASFAPELPWVHCNNSWNSPQCIDFKINSTDSNATETNFTDPVTALLPHSPAWEYFHRAVLESQGSGGLHEIGLPKLELVMCLFVVYVMLYLSLFKGVKSTGIVVWATATLPYVVLTILLLRGLMLPGAITGIVYYLKPQLTRLCDTQVWVDAAVQVFYSVGAGFGVHLSYASYNNFNNDCYRDCLITTAVNCFTSFFSGFVIFTYLGYMSDQQGIPISSVATEGPGLVFQVYPEAVATLPGSQIWAVLFFFMLIMLGIDSAMGGLECVITGLMDEFCLFFAGKKYAREIFTACAIAVSFCVATVNVTPGGIYMFHLFDTYSAGISLLCSALFEAIAVSWFYGLERFTGDVELMLGHRPGLYWRICWKFISPSFIIGVVVFGLLYREPLKYNDYTYPTWAELIGWGLALSSILMIPTFVISQLCRAQGTLKENSIPLYFCTIILVISLVRSLVKRIKRTIDNNKMVPSNSLIPERTSFIHHVHFENAANSLASAYPLQRDTPASVTFVKT